MNKPAASSREAEWQPLRKLWAEAVSEARPQVRWWKDEGCLIWEMKTTLPLAGRAAFKAEGFVEGLWKQDVAEFFIMDGSCGHYQEFNLSPGGAWWSARFASPRILAAVQPDWTQLGVKTRVLWTPTHWIGQMSLPFPDCREAVLNFCAIRQGLEGPSYYSLAALGGTKPDFHRPHEWRAWAI